MGIFKLSDDVVFNLPTDFEAIENISDEGEVMHYIKSEKSYDDEGNAKHKLSVNLSVNDFEDSQTISDLIDEKEAIANEEFSNINIVYSRPNGNSDVVIYSLAYSPTVLLGLKITVVITTGLVKINSQKYLQVVSMHSFNGITEDTQEKFSYTLKVLNTLKINGNQLKISVAEQKKIIKQLSNCICNESDSTTEHVMIR